MRYITTDHRIAEGTVWAPGPLPLSVWVLPADGTAAVVVKVPRGDVSAAHAVDYALPTLTTRYGTVVWHHADRGTVHAPDACVPPVKYHHAPALPARVWRELTA